MKGRRRARRVALQALYELDLSGHDLDLVLSGRLADLYHSAAVAAVASRDWALVEAVAALEPLGGIDATEVASLERRLVVAPGRMADAVHFARLWVPHARYCNWLVRGVWRRREALDAVIARIAPEWPIPQMAPVDRNVLRIGLWELGGRTVPVRVAVNEAVELARAFSGDGSRRMVNGALGTFVSGHMELPFEVDALESDSDGGDP
jgi:transcription antitermination factor NusB